MTTIIRIFEGDDLIIPAEVFEALGIKPGDSVEIRAASDEPESWDADDRAHRLAVLRALRGTWTQEDQSAFEKARQEMWWT